jgi:hypothetical protein
VLRLQESTSKFGETRRVPVGSRREDPMDDLDPRRLPAGVDEPEG